MKLTGAVLGQASSLSLTMTSLGCFEGEKNGGGRKLALRCMEGEKCDNVKGLNLNLNSIFFVLFSEFSSACMCMVVYFEM